MMNLLQDCFHSFIFCHKFPGSLEFLLHGGMNIFLLSTYQTYERLAKRCPFIDLDWFANSNFMVIKHVNIYVDNNVPNLRKEGRSIYRF